MLREKIGQIFNRKYHTSNVFFINLFIVTLIAYFTRTIFPPLKFVFVFLCIVSFALLLVYNCKNFKIKELKYLALPIVVLLFYVLGIIQTSKAYSFLYKELINGIIVLLFISLLISYKKYSLYIKYFASKIFLLVLTLIGIVALIRWPLMLFDYQIPLKKYLFAGPDYSFPLVTDGNIYAMYFLIGVIITYSLVLKNRLNKIYAGLIYIVLFSNITFSFSRRGYIVFVLILVSIVIYTLFYIKNLNIRRSTCTLLLSIFLLSSIFYTLFLSVRFKLFEYDQKAYAISFQLNRISFLTNPGETPWNFRYRIWSKIDNDYWKQFQDNDDKANLIYNGDFRYGSLFWDTNTPSNQFKMELHDEDSIRFMRLNRKSGDGYYQLYYKGRENHYYGGVKYTLKFKYRVIQGGKRPFFVGWWAYDNGQYRQNLKPKINELNDSWKDCTIEYKFTQDHDILPLLINSQQPGSIVDIADVRMYSNDTIERPGFTRQIFESNNSDRVIKLPSIEGMSEERTERWSFALNLWQNYSILDKLKGQGFNYLERFGEKFYSNKKRLDYPHNPIISSFLFSGIIGGVFYMFFLIMSLFFYIKNFNRFKLIFIIYILMMFFMMVSGNSHFSVPIFTFFSFIPFIFRNRNYTLKKDRER